ncbi:MAG: M10 family metallopeptidase C-terminal domain-containing protein [Rubrivivax sp.]|jgi:serralysin|nr:M10 family metallopeptidase C-terminal domain-containing protein [Rubrivivax sp.]
MPTPISNSVSDPDTDGASLQDEAIRGLLQGGAWHFDGPRLLTYSLHADMTLPRGWAAPMAAMDQAFAAWSAVANIRFRQIAGPRDYRHTPADLAIVVSRDLSGIAAGAAAISVPPDSAFARSGMGLGSDPADYPRPEGDIFLNVLSREVSSSAPGGTGFAIRLHEIGHALGLKHPHDDGGNGRPTFDSLGIGGLDNGLATLMSYERPFADAPSNAQGCQITPMVLDILAIQHIYGANMGHRTGNDTYFLHDDNKVRAIWDAGGADTLNATWLRFAVTLSLAEGATIEHGRHSRTAIAYGVTIENAIGSRYDDTLTGNAANNLLDGRRGADSMAGGAGNDTYVVDSVLDEVLESAAEGVDTVRAAVGWTLADNVENLVLVGAAALDGTGNDGDNVLTGNAGANRLSGGAGDDTYVVQNAADSVIELFGMGVDTVRSSLSWRLSDNVENLVLVGAAAINGTGNAGDNSLVGNAAANRLDGGGGNDAMAGGLGNDTYIVDSAGDSVLEASARATEIDTVRASIDYTLGANLEILVLTGVDNISGTGNALGNTLVGNAGANLLDGAGGADRLLGGAGNDTYIVDVVRNGAGVMLQDVVVEAANAGLDTLVLRTAGDLGLAASAGLALGAGLENLDASGTGSHRFNLTGNALDNALTGNAADNVLRGGSGADTLIGGAGDDELRGGGGNDLLDGGDGADRFVFDTPLNALNNLDRIGEFVAEIDRFLLDRRVFAGLAPGALAADAFASGAGMAAAATASQRIVYDLSNGMLYWDADGKPAYGANKAPVAFARIVSDIKPDLTAGDFLAVSS